MNTLVLNGGSTADLKNVTRVAVDVLGKGGLVVFPTETVYGLGADAANGPAVRSVFAAKGRPMDNPLIVHVSGIDQITTVSSSAPEIAYRLGEAFWPGPLTLVLEGNGSVAPEATAGRSTVAVRVPDHAVPIAITRALGRGIVGPSANSSGRPSPTEARHVLHDLNGKVDVIIDAGPTRIGLESTVVDVTGEYPVVLRKGGLPVEEIEKISGKVVTLPPSEMLSRSPGTRYRHYAPTARVIRIGPGDAEGLREALYSEKQEHRKIGAVVRTIVCDPAEVTLLENVSGSLEVYAQRLFSILRSMDDHGIEVIIVEEPPPGGLGSALLDRISRAAGKDPL